MAKEFFGHMRQLQVQHLHAYIVEGYVEFDSNGLAWHGGNYSQEPPSYDAVDWTYVRTFPPELRYAAMILLLKLVMH